MVNHVVVTNKILIFLLILAFFGCANASTDKEQKSIIYLDSLVNALQLYKLDTGDYPCGVNALKKLVTNIDNNTKWRGPYLNPDVAHLNFSDGWGNQFFYQYPCKSELPEFRLYSLGKNGVDDNGKKDDILYKKP
jgi:general secretion pathway protein G